FPGIGKARTYQHGDRAHSTTAQLGPYRTGPAEPDGARRAPLRLRTPAVFGVGEAARRARRARSLPPQPSAAAAFLAAAAASWATAASCRTIPGRRVADAGRRPAIPGSATSGPAPVEAYVPGPIVRVGIVVDATRSVVTAEGGVVVRETTTGVAREVPLPRATF